MNKAVIILALSGLLFSPIGAMAAPKAPNVIVILIDDMGWIDSAPYGSEYYDTPNLTRLAEDLKLIRYYHEGKNAASHAYDLFDLERDPSEAINLSAYLPEE
ncbi:MAG: hypothetical protein GY725_24715, partial [bacterium]|nr:hypothetical protein [bacterium]